MKSARERAAEMAAMAGLTARGRFAIALELSFKEHARDQRHLCAEAVTVVMTSPDAPAVLFHASAASISYGAAMNAPPPGEDQPDREAEERAAVEGFIRMWPNSPGKVDAHMAEWKKRRDSGK